MSSSLVITHDDADQEPAAGEHGAAPRRAPEPAAADVEEPSDMKPMTPEAEMYRARYFR